MKIVICASLDFTYEIKEIADKIIQLGHDVVLPPTSEMILRGEITLDGIKQEKENGEFSERVIEHNSIKNHFEKIKQGDAILVSNFDKKGIKNYIGGNTFLEMGFAHVLNKKIFLLNEPPEISYKDEILAMQPVILNGDLNKIE